MSQQERLNWGAFIVNAWITGWYFLRVLGMPGDSALLGPGMTGFIIQLIIAAILISIACEMALRWLQKRSGGGDPGRREKPDERDRLINLRAGRNGYVVLLVGVAIILGHIASTQWLSAIQPAAGAATTVLTRLAVGPLTGPLIAQLLLLALTLAGLSKYLTRIVCYRRGY